MLLLVTVRMQAAPVVRSAPDQDGGATRTTTTTTTSTADSSAATLVSLAKRAAATLALASFLTSAGSVGEAAFSSPMAGGGTGRSTGGVLVAPAFAELEPLPLKSYSEEFSSALAPVNTVRGKSWCSFTVIVEVFATPQDRHYTELACVRNEQAVKTT